MTLNVFRIVEARSAEQSLASWGKIPFAPNIITRIRRLHMPYVQTVSGRISPDSIRFCHCHEHLFIRRGKSFDVNPALCIDNYEKTLSEVRDFCLAGGTTIIDAQPVGCGRMARELKKLAGDLKIQLLASTGFHKIIFYPDGHWIFSSSVQQLTELFLHEISTGMYDGSDGSLCRYIDARAGIIKCALDTTGINAQYEKLFCAAADAANITNAPLMVHIEKGSSPLALADYLERKKVNLKRVIFCHMDRACFNLDIHKELCRRGIYLEYDTIARPKYHDDKKEALIFTALIQSGFENNLLFSLDTTRKRLKSYTPEGAGLTYILRSFIPLLKAYGVTDRQIKKIACENCRRILAI